MKSDARIRYTKMRIKDALFELLKTKNLHKITVTEICEVAEINRSTFYVHYLDVFDLFDKVEEEILSSLEESWSQLAPKSSVEGMEKILSSLKKSQYDTVKLIFKNDPNFSDRITEMIFKSVASDYQIIGRTDFENKMINRIIINGLGNVTRYWLISNDKNKPSAHELAVFFFNTAEKLTH